MHLVAHAFGGVCVWRRVHFAAYAFDGACIWRRVHLGVGYYYLLRSTCYKTNQILG
jgi:hypothetical protein